MPKQAVVFVHGIGTQSSGFSHETREMLRTSIKQHIAEITKGTLSVTDNQFESEIQMEDAWWAPITDEAESTLWDRVKKDPTTNTALDQVALRRFMVQFIGDALAYQRPPESSKQYDEIHSKLKEKVALLRKLDNEIEITFVAHSLGTVISSNFLYDIGPHKDTKAPFSPANFFTLGSPIALWTLLFGHPDSANRPVKPIAPHGVWINILDDDDIVGYPLKNLNDAYREAVTFDYVTEIGGAFTKNNPASHMCYWTDSNAVEPIARKLAMDFLRIQKWTGTIGTINDYIAFIKNLWQW